MIKKLSSIEDSSVNFVEEALTGFLESRYVRKVPEYFICYLSSQSGCNKGCRFCHLTTTKQTKFENSTRIDYITQASQILKHYNKQKAPAEYIHYNFMARGEALANPNLLINADQILYELGKVATDIDPNLGVKFNISTILPKGLNKPLSKIFQIIHPTIYYSLYSVNEDFRQKWMPQALPLKDALNLLVDYQVYSKKKVKIHHCFIKDINDSIQEVQTMCSLLEEVGLDFEFNLVRYNPYSSEQGEESDEKVLQRNLAIIDDYGWSKEIPRVGFDVKASCGMFVGK